MADSIDVEPTTSVAKSNSRWTEDLLAILVGTLLLIASLSLVRFQTRLAAPEAGAEQADVEQTEVVHLADGWVAKPGSWLDSPLEAFGGLEAGLPKLVGSAVVVGVLTLVLCLALRVSRQSIQEFVPAFIVVALIALLAYTLAGQAWVKSKNLEYALWALLLGLLISNLWGTPAWLMRGARTEFFIKSGLVLLGAEILVGRLTALGLPGVCVAWVVTPIVLVSTFWFGQKVLRMASPSLNMVISADMSVCGVSAAIASAAACRAKKEELSFAVGLSLSFTVLMMIVMPAVIGAVGMNPVLAGAWMGGTIDSTGAVAAAGALLGDEALTVAATVKMIQNILIGVIAFGIAVYWTTFVEARSDGSRVAWSEIWVRFPKFILGFVIASIVFSVIHASGDDGEAVAKASNAITKTFRGWLFCLAFVSIGLETNFRRLSANFGGGKPLVLYVCGQSLNLALTFAMAYLMFEVVFPDAANGLQ